MQGGHYDGAMQTGERALRLAPSAAEARLSIDATAVVATGDRRGAFTWPGDCNCTSAIDTQLDDANPDI